MKPLRKGLGLATLLFFCSTDADVQKRGSFLSLSRGVAVETGRPIHESSEALEGLLGDCFASLLWRHGSMPVPGADRD